ncbi:hypothetical protein FHU41_002477 [Psychromicrobium silvestre]|uniref:Uncharacterized protein n=1 Tax=Psychromicrobium silvestre TaxID=1645614 RepID=A0A7Y9LV96_9MICC|nr:hypothetical protein [Psychromicrobium silvestre]NYE96227.1 hypothetical protein [Psychromicrobium silvestre]
MNMELVDQYSPVPRGVISRQMLRRWRTISSRAHWRVAQDWWMPEVEQVIDQGWQGASLLDSARQLGAARCRQGVGVTEALIDFRCYFKASLRHPNLNAIQAFVEGWVTQTEETDPFSCTDPVTGLGTKAHFSRMLYDLQLAGDTAPIVLAALTLSPKYDKVEPLTWTQLTVLGSIFLEVFRGIEATMMYEGSTVYILAPKSPDFFAALLNCQAKISISLKFQNFHSKLTCEPLPQQEANFQQLLNSMHR